MKPEDARFRARLEHHRKRARLAALARSRTPAIKPAAPDPIEAARVERLACVEREREQQARHPFAGDFDDAGSWTNWRPPSEER